MDIYIPVHPIEVRGTTYHVKVDASGTWFADAGGSTVTAPTKDALAIKLRQLTAEAAVTVEIPFVLLASGSGGKNGPARGVITGIHAGNGNLLVSWATGWQAGKKAQWTPGYNDLILAGSTSEETIEQWQELDRVKREASKKLYEFEMARKINLKDLAVAAIKKAVTDGSEG
jgi:hypothetical protein